ncbi:MAG: NAD(P)/FAD-dependent oxidoreductase [Firmicutes bacterium]|nr:NAD(P)/FAD-dependent oxidoreductase [Bacillota bacterium]
MEGKIIVVGAGHGGLVTAELLGRHGCDVVIYEQNRQGEVSYDWHDDVTPHVFDRLGIPLPEPRCYFKKRDWTFITPDGNHAIRIYQDEEKIDLSMERRPLVEMLIERAAESAAICFNTAVDGLIVENNRVRGVLAGGKRVYADLVIDSSGVNSILREQLPESYGIQRYPRQDELIYAYRAFYERRAGSKDPDHTNKAYLKHLGEAGISWCILDPSGQVNVLVGRIGRLDQSTLHRSLQALRDDNEIIGERVLRGGVTLPIPIRYPLSRMAGPGYAAVGDSAFMTIPLLGSGIAHAMTAGRILGEVIISAENSPFAEDNLWRYQVRAMEAFGAQSAGVDILKRWLLSADNDDLSYLMGRKIIEADEMKKVAVGELIELSPAAMLRKLLAGYRKTALLLQLNRVLGQTRRAKKLALSLPQVYDKVKVARWQSQYDRFMQQQPTVN